MHRPSALNDPFAPLSHHWTDATHITYGVLTAGIFTRRFKLEGSLFNGREPDEGRYDPDFHSLSSYGTRVSVNPGPHWALSASYGHLDSPEAIHPGEDQDRLGASILHTADFGAEGDWATALVYGANKRAGIGLEDHGWEHSVIFESNLQWDRSDSFFGRLEYVRKSGDELALSGALGGEEFDLGAVSLGYVRELADWGGATAGVGFRGSVNLVPRSLEQAYGSRTPAGVAVFFRVRPALLQGGHANEARHRMPGMPQHR
jgi:hypothetical protein